MISRRRWPGVTDIGDHFFAAFRRLDNVEEFIEVTPTLFP